MRHNGYGAYWRTGRALYFEWQTDKKKFIDLVSGQVFEKEVFHDMNAVTNQQNDVTRQRHAQVRVNATVRIPTQMIRTNCPDLLIRQLLRGISAHAATDQVPGRIIPACPVTCPYQNHISLVKRHMLSLSIPKIHFLPDSLFVIGSIDSTFKAPGSDCCAPTINGDDCAGGIARLWGDEEAGDLGNLLNVCRSFERGGVAKCFDKL